VSLGLLDPVDDEAVALDALADGEPGAVQRGHPKWCAAARWRQVGCRFLLADDAAPRHVLSM
jgi:hypothetical protein